MLNNYSFRTQIIIKILFPIILIVGLIFTYTGIYIYQKDIDTAKIIGEAEAAEYAAIVEDFFNSAFNTANNIATIVESVRVDQVIMQADDSKEISGTEKKENVRLIMKKILEKNRDYYAVWLVMEPNAFNGQDLYYTNQLKYDKNGSFMPYWYREGKELKYKLAFANYDERLRNDKYNLAFSSGKEIILEPYYTELANGEKGLFTTLAVPIKIGEKVIGVAGIDIDLTKLNEINNEVKLYDTGFGRIISNTGVVVAHPDQTRIGKPLGELNDKSGSIVLEKMAKGERFTDFAYSEALKMTTFKSFIPIHISKTSTPWYYTTVVKKEEILRDAYYTLKIIISMAVAGIILLTTIILLFGNSISKPLKKVTNYLKQIADYDLTILIDQKDEKYKLRKDEIGRNFQATIQMTEDLTILIKKIREAANHVAASAEEFKTTNEQILLASNEVAKAIEDVANGAMNQAKDTENGANKALEIGKIIDQAITSIATLNQSVENNQAKSESNKTITDLIEMAEETANSLKEIKDVVLNVQEGSTKIDKASYAIQEISEQINLLSLNAAIEAARAGEYGKGFAVVASEIRKLADKSNHLTKEINEIIYGLSGRTTELVNTVKNVEKITKEQKESIKLIVIKFREEINQLNSSTKELQKKKEELLNIVESLAAIAEQNAAATEEASASVEEQTAAIEELNNTSTALAQLAKEIKSQVNTFKLNE